jgi:RES domain-containing protein
VEVYRLCKTKHAASPLDGEGARKRGGRWGPAGIPIAYCSATISLCALELLVNMDVSVAPTDYVSIAVTIPDEDIEDLPEKVLPKGWEGFPYPGKVQALGRDWAVSKRSLVLRVPSAVVPVERNYLVNPLHPDFPRVTWKVPRPFAFDPRLLARP